MVAVSGHTSLAGIVGYPVSHSLSPAMHNAAFAALGLDWIYLPFPVHPDRLPQAVAGLKALGVKGFSVTIPHKVEVIPLLDRLTRPAELAGAVNTVALQDGEFVGYNTDGLGLVRSLELDLGFVPAGRSVLLLGAGGAARGAVAALALAGAGRISLVNRSRGRADQLVACLNPQLPGVILSSDPVELLADPEYLAGFDLIVNTTSVGMAGDSFPGLALPADRPEFAVYDMVYAPPVTPLLARARSLGLPCANGLGMLVAQGEAAFAIWTGTPPPEGCMAAQLALSVRK